jgi:hypothetical protein
MRVSGALNLPIRVASLPAAAAGGTTFSQVIWAVDHTCGGRCEDRRRSSTLDSMPTSTPPCRPGTLTTATPSAADGGTASGQKFIDLPTRRQPKFKE